MNIFVISQQKNNQNNTVDDDNYGGTDRKKDSNVKNRSEKFYFFSIHNISRGGEDKNIYQMIFMLPLSFMSRRSLSLTLALYLSPFVCLSLPLSLFNPLGLSC